MSVSSVPLTPDALGNEGGGGGGGPSAATSLAGVDKYAIENIGGTSAGASAGATADVGAASSQEARYKNHTQQTKQTRCRSPTSPLPISFVAMFGTRRFLDIEEP